jgi:hypothetical protein
MGTGGFMDIVESRAGVYPRIAEFAPVIDAGNVIHWTGPAKQRWTFSVYVLPLRQWAGLAWAWGAPVQRMRLGAVGMRHLEAVNEGDITIALHRPQAWVANGKFALAHISERHQWYNDDWLIEQGLILPPGTLTLADASRQFGITYRNAWLAVKLDNLEAREEGGRWYVEREEFDRWYRGRRVTRGKDV